MDTLVENTNAEKDAKKVDLEADPMPMRFHTVDEEDAEREQGLGVRMQDTSERDARWRELR
jgi:hypothetical protein